jgi:polyisoprenoid-binding protein YceI
MKKRRFWITATSLILAILVVIIAGFLYTAHFASNVASSQQHVASGAIQVTVTPPTSAGASTQLQTFQIVPAQSTASYSVFEDLVYQNKPNNDAVGTTHSVQGNFQIQSSKSPLVTGMNIKIDLRTLQSDAQRRDNFIQQNTLQTALYPYATFVSVSTKDLPSSYSNGQIVNFQIIGNLTIHGKTNGETFTVRGKLTGNTITGTATTTIFMTDFGMQPPDLANIAIAQNKVQITLDFTATKN